MAAQCRQKSCTTIANKCSLLMWVIMNFLRFHRQKAYLNLRKDKSSIYWAIQNSRESSSCRNTHGITRALRFECLESSNSKLQVKDGLLEFEKGLRMVVGAVSSPCPRSREQEVAVALGIIQISSKGAPNVQAHIHMNGCYKGHSVATHNFDNTQPNDPTLFSDSVSDLVPRSSWPPPW
ncbi:hypothetical protein EJ110_NYTH17319 [Nymphaea thermarum]|nr:hypothetical protein EJ110_NYTH17319 [Nymphaea thermarum]